MIQSVSPRCVMNSPTREKRIGHTGIPREGPGQTTMRAVISAISLDAGDTMLHCDPSPAETSASALGRFGHAVDALLAPLDRGQELENIVGELKDDAWDDVL